MSTPLVRSIEAVKAPAALRPGSVVSMGEYLQGTLGVGPEQKSLTLYHRTDTQWPAGATGNLDLTKGGGKFGKGFYTASEPVSIYGSKTFELELDLAKLRQRRVLITNGFFDDTKGLPPGVDIVASAMDFMNRSAIRYFIFKPSAQPWLEGATVRGEFVAER